ncbi:hypothetical protein PFICI_14920 [Pestalotiopsis fici W106-1]|uniref:Uncharacterized protein n=1 Tax=Pestalotiopsis fici (strain W106-1 / CGMCC3.15140) TaxID=1229662 RepID=W3WHC5_PESFW|nr:uncharacterized protein PFICI_14920 [Pestalotiopsis fici W106-1]ETS73315.1 hypothetical protein PFICI_14920 [Pestalotiopsis fici W106-1]
MSHRQIGFDDERRRSVPYSAGDNLRADTYRPNEPKDRGRESDRDRYKDGNRDYARDRDRRDDRRVDRQPEQSPRRTLSTDQGKNDDSRPRSLPLSKIDTSGLNATKGPRTPRTPSSLSGNASPAVSRGSQAPTASSSTHTTDTSKPAASRPSSPSNSTMPAPKAICPEQQPAIDAMHKVVDSLFWRYKYQLEYHNKGKEIEARDQELKKLKAEFPYQPLKFQQGVKERIVAERGDVHAKFKQVDSKMSSYLRTTIAEIAGLVNRQPTSTITEPERQVPQFSDPAPLIASMEERFSALEKRCAESQTAANEVIAALQRERADTDQKIKHLTDGQATAEKEMEELKNGRAAAEQEVKDLKALLTTISKKDPIDNDARKETKDVKRLLDESIETLRKSIEAIQQEMTQNFKSAKEQRANFEKELRDGIASLQDRASSLESLTDEITHVKGLETKLNQSVAILETRLDIQGQALSKCEDSSRTINNLTSEVSKLGTMMGGLQETFNDMDHERIDEILDDWTTHNLKQMILDSMSSVKALQTDVGLLKTSKPQGSWPHDEESKDSRQPSVSHVRKAPSMNMDGTEGSIVDEIRQELSSLKEEVGALRKSISEGEKSLLEKVQSTVVQGSEMMAGEIDGIDGRTKDLATRVGILESKGIQARTPAPTPQLDSRVSPVTIDSHLSNRIKAIEDADLVTSLNNVTEKLDQYCQLFDLSQRQAGIEEINRVKIACQNLSNTMREQNSSVRGQLDQQELQLQNLNAHFNNMNTRGMAQTILSQLDAYTTRFSPQFDLVHARLDRMEGRFDTYARRFQSDPNGQDPSNKRPSVTLESDAANKRRRVASGSPAFGTPAYASFSGPGSGLAPQQQMPQPMPQPMPQQIPQQIPQQMPQPMPQQIQPRHILPQQIQQMPTQSR